MATSTTEYECRTPVVLIIFRRPDTTARVVESLAQVRPRQLYVIADGPRADHPDDRRLCKQTRALVADLEWDCEVHRDFANENLGLRERISTGLDRAFARYERAIVLEDDTVPDPTFFRFCDELLERYAGDERIMSVTGSNLFGRGARGSDSYFFSRYESCWGWASWRSAWETYDASLSAWPAFRDSGRMDELFESPFVAAHWTRLLDRVHSGKLDSWAYAWRFAHWANHGLAAIPDVNLVSNIGFGVEATHTRADKHAFAALRTESLAFPLEHPDFVVRERSAERAFEDVVVPKAFARRAAGRLTQTAHELRQAVRRRLGDVEDESP